MSYRPNPDNHSWTRCRDALVQTVGLWGAPTYFLQCPVAPRYASSFESKEDRAVSVTFTAKGHPERKVTVDRFERPVDNLWALAKGLDAIRLNELRGLDDVARQVYQALPAPAKRRDPFEVLGLRPDASQEDIKDMYRLKARRLHSDVAGGNDEAMKELNEAFAAVKGS